MAKDPNKTKDPLIRKFNLEFKETFFKSEKLNFSLLSCLVHGNLRAMGYKLPAKPHIDQNLVKKYLKQLDESDPNAFRNLDSKGLGEIALEIVRKYDSKVKAG